MPSTQLLNQINKMCQVELEIHSSTFVVKSYFLLKATFCAHKATVCPTGFRTTFADLLFQDNLCRFACSELLAERISFCLQLLMSFEFRVKSS